MTFTALICNLKIYIVAFNVINVVFNGIIFTLPILVIKFKLKKKLIHYKVQSKMYFLLIIFLQKYF